MSNTKSFENPYKAELDSGSDRIKIGTTIPTEAYHKVRSVSLGQGAIGNTIAILWDKFTHELEQRGITNFNQSAAFEHLLVNSRLVLPGEAYDTQPDGPAVTHVHGGPAPLPDGQAANRNVQRGESGVRRRPTSAPAGSPDIKVGPNAGSGGSGGSGRKATR